MQITQHSLYEVRRVSYLFINLSFQVDQLMALNIEIASNRRMRAEHMKQVSLSFNTASLESVYCRSRAIYLKSEATAACLLWICVLLCQLLLFQGSV